jgi:hypothetical protein
MNQAFGAKVSESHHNVNVRLGARLTCPDTWLLVNPVASCLPRFLRTVEEGYLDNPYHNCIHASDVLQTMHVLLRRGGLVPGYVDPVTHMACLLAAVSQ